MPEIEIKKLDVISVAKIGAILGLLWGIITGVIAALTISAVGISSAIPQMPAISTGAISIIILIVYIAGGLIYGFIGGAISALLYNVAAKWVGGITFEH